MRPSPPGIAESGSWVECRIGRQGAQRRGGRQEWSCLASEFAKTRLPSAKPVAPMAGRRASMQQHLLTDVYGLLFLLLIAGYAFRLAWRRSRHGPTVAWNRTSRATWRYLFRLVVTSVVAFAIVLTVADDSA